MTEQGSDDEASHGVVIMRRLCEGEAAVPRPGDVMMFGRDEEAALRPRGVVMAVAVVVAMVSRQAQAMRCLMVRCNVM